MTNSERERLLAIPATALTKSLGKLGTPAFFYVQRKGKNGKLRTERRTLVTAVDRLRRCTEEHPAGGGLTLDEALEEIQRLLAHELAPWPGLQTTSVEMDDAGRQAVWTRLLAPWPRFELNAVSLDKSGTVKTRGKLDVPGGGTIWTIDALTSPAGMAAVCGIARGGLNVYWRPVQGERACLLVDDWTKPPPGPDLRPEAVQTEAQRMAALELLRWAQPYGFLQTSRWKTQAVYVLEGALLEHGRELVARMNRAYGDTNVRDLNHWVRLPGLWNWKKEPWCCRVLKFGTCRPMADAWLAQELQRLRVVQKEESRPAPSLAKPSASRLWSGVETFLASFPEEIQPANVHLHYRNTAATRVAARWYVRCHGDVAGCRTVLRAWLAGTPEPRLTAHDMDVITHSMACRDWREHPERWVGLPEPTTISGVPASQGGDELRRTAFRSAPGSAPSAPKPSDVPPPKMQTRDMTMEEDGRALQFLPEVLRTLDVCLAACQQNGTAMEFVPERLKTPGFCMEAVQADWRALQFVPEALKTPGLCMVAVRGGGWALKVVPEALKTPELCMEAVRKNGWALWWVPNALKTPALCMEAVQQDGMALKHVPERLKTPALCVVAVRADRQALDYVPDCIRAGARRPTADRRFPSSRKTGAVRISGIALGYVPDDVKTPEICLAAVKSDGLEPCLRESGRELKPFRSRFGRLPHQPD